MITPEQKVKLETIFDYFGKSSESNSIENKFHKLFFECGEYRDSYSMNGRFVKETVKEVTDVLSCCLQIYMHDVRVRDQFDKTLDETISKIKDKYYD